MESQGEGSLNADDTAGQQGENVDPGGVHPAKHVNEDKESKLSATDDYLDTGDQSARKPTLEKRDSNFGDTQTISVEANVAKQNAIVAIGDAKQNKNIPESPTQDESIGVQQDADSVKQTSSEVEVIETKKNELNEDELVPNEVHSKSNEVNTRYITQKIQIPRGYDYPPTPEQRFQTILTLLREKRIEREKQKFALQSVQNVIKSVHKPSNTIYDDHKAGANINHKGANAMDRGADIIYDRRHTAPAIEITGIPDRRTIEVWENNKSSSSSSQRSVITDTQLKLAVAEEKKAKRRLSSPNLKVTDREFQLLLPAVVNHDRPEVVQDGGHEGEPDPQYGQPGISPQNSAEMPQQEEVPLESEKEDEPDTFQVLRSADSLSRKVNLTTVEFGSVKANIIGGSHEGPNDVLVDLSLHCEDGSNPTKSDSARQFPRHNGDGRRRRSDRRMTIDEAELNIWDLRAPVDGKAALVEGLADHRQDRKVENPDLMPPPSSINEKEEKNSCSSSGPMSGTYPSMTGTPLSGAESLLVENEILQSPEHKLELQNVFARNETTFQYEKRELEDWRIAEAKQEEENFMEATAPGSAKRRKKKSPTKEVGSKFALLDLYSPKAGTGVKDRRREILAKRKKEGPYDENKFFDKVEDREAEAPFADPSNKAEFHRLTREVLNMINEDRETLHYETDDRLGRIKRNGITEQRRNAERDLWPAALELAENAKDGALQCKIISNRIALRKEELRKEKLDLMERKKKLLSAGRGVAKITVLNQLREKEKEKLEKARRRQFAELLTYGVVLPKTDDSQVLGTILEEVREEKRLQEEKAEREEQARLRFEREEEAQLEKEKRERLEQERLEEKLEEKRRRKEEKRQWKLAKKKTEQAHEEDTDAADAEKEAGELLAESESKSSERSDIKWKKKRSSSSSSDEASSLTKTETSGSKSAPKASHQDSSEPPRLVNLNRGITDRIVFENDIDPHNDGTKLAFFNHPDYNGPRPGESIESWCVNQKEEDDNVENQNYEKSTKKKKKNSVISYYIYGDLREPDPRSGKVLAERDKTSLYKESLGEASKIKIPPYLRYDLTEERFVEDWSHLDELAEFYAGSNYPKQPYIEKSVDQLEIGLEQLSRGESEFGIGMTDSNNGEIHDRKIESDRDESGSNAGSNQASSRTSRSSGSEDNERGRRGKKVYEDQKNDGQNPLKDDKKNASLKGNTGSGPRHFGTPEDPWIITRFPYMPLYKQCIDFDLKKQLKKLPPLRKNSKDPLPTVDGQPLIPASTVTGSGKVEKNLTSSPASSNLETLPTTRFPEKVAEKLFEKVPDKLFEKVKQVITVDKPMENEKNVRLLQEGANQLKMIRLELENRILTEYLPEKAYEDEIKMLRKKVEERDAKLEKLDKDYRNIVKEVVWKNGKIIDGKRIIPNKEEVIPTKVDDAHIQPDNQPSKSDDNVIADDQKENLPMIKDYIPSIKDSVPNVKLTKVEKSKRCAEKRQQHRDDFETQRKKRWNLWKTGRCSRETSEEIVAEEFIDIDENKTLRSWNGNVSGTVSSHRNTPIQPIDDTTENLNRETSIEMITVEERVSVDKDSHTLLDERISNIRSAKSESDEQILPSRTVESSAGKPRVTSSTDNINIWAHRPGNLSSHFATESILSSVLTSMGRDDIDDKPGIEAEVNPSELEAKKDELTLNNPVQSLFDHFDARREEKRKLATSCPRREDRHDHRGASEDSAESLNHLSIPYIERMNLSLLRDKVSDILPEDKSEKALSILSINGSRKLYDSDDSRNGETVSLGDLTPTNEEAQVDADPFCKMLEDSVKFTINMEQSEKQRQIAEKMAKTLGHWMTKNGIRLEDHEPSQPTCEISDIPQSDEYSEASIHIISSAQNISPQHSTSSGTSVSSQGYVRDFVGLVLEKVIKKNQTDTKGSCRILNPFRERSGSESGIEDYYDTPLTPLSEVDVVNIRDTIVPKACNDYDDVTLESSIGSVFKEEEYCPSESVPHAYRKDKSGRFDHLAKDEHLSVVSDPGLSRTSSEKSYQPGTYSEIKPTAPLDGENVESSSSDTNSDLKSLPSLHMSTAPSAEDEQSAERVEHKEKERSKKGDTADPPKPEKPWKVADMLAQGQETIAELHAKNQENLARIQSKDTRKAVRFSSHFPKFNKKALKHAATHLRQELRLDQVDSVESGDGNGDADERGDSDAIPSSEGNKKAANHHQTRIDNEQNDSANDDTAGEKNQRLERRDQDEHPDPSDEPPYPSDDESPGNDDMPHPTHDEASGEDVLHPTDESPDEDWDTLLEGMDRPLSDEIAQPSSSESQGRDEETDSLFEGEDSLQRDRLRDEEVKEQEPDERDEDPEEESHTSNSPDELTLLNSATLPHSAILPHSVTLSHSQELNTLLTGGKNEEDTSRYLEGGEDEVTVDNRNDNGYPLSPGNKYDIAMDNEQSSSSEIPSPTPRFYSLNDDPTIELHSDQESFDLDQRSVHNPHPSFDILNPTVDLYDQSRDFDQYDETVELHDKSPVVSEKTVVLMRYPT